jgi:hypothetical protein
MTVVRIPPVFRTRPADSATSTCPARRSARCSKCLLHNGTLQSFINVYLDGTDVDMFDGLDTLVERDATLLLLPAMAGGRR